MRDSFIHRVKGFESLLSQVQRAVGNEGDRNPSWRGGVGGRTAGPPGTCHAARLGLSRDSLRGAAHVSCAR